MELIFFSGAHGIFSRIDHILGHESSLGKSKILKSFHASFFNHNAVRLEVNYRKIILKNTNIWRLRNTLLNNQQIMEESKRKSKYA